MLRLLSIVFIKIIIIIIVYLYSIFEFDILETPCNSITLRPYKSLASGLRPEHSNNACV